MAPFEPSNGPHVGGLLLVELARLWKAASDREAVAGRRLTQKQLSSSSRVPVQTISSWSTGTHLPHNLDQLAAVGRVLAELAGEPPSTLRDWSRLLDDQRTSAKTDHLNGIGRPVGEVSPFDLEVHRPVEIDGVEDLPELPIYVQREHDDRLAQVVAAAVAGRSGMAVLVAGSSTGKTRACWEAVQQLPDGWRIWHPYDPTRPEAALAQLPQVGPRTVVWLNETQFYLHTRDDSGERLAAGLRALLTDPDRGQVLILGTLWPEHWDTLTRPATPGSDDPHAQARTLLTGTDVAVPDSFDTSALARLAEIAGDDARLTQAETHTTDGKITQYLAGVPALLARYQHAPPVARALIHTAMDARRLGHRRALSLTLLETAVPGYLTDDEWDYLPEDWLETALTYNAVPCKGVRGPLTRIRPRYTQLNDDRGPHYLLADYLEQTGRTTRREIIPPNSFWNAATAHAHPDDHSTLAKAAQARGLYRHAAQLHKSAIRHSDATAGHDLVRLLHQVHPTDQRPATWTATHVALNHPTALHHPFEVAILLSQLQTMGMDQQATALADRIANDIVLDGPLSGTAFLLDTLQKTEMDQQATTLADRIASDTALDHPSLVVILVDILQDAGMGQQATTLADRIAANTTLDNPYEIALALNSLQKTGMDKQVTTLTDRAATDTTHDVGVLLSLIQTAETKERATTPAEPATDTALNHPDNPAAPLDGWRQAKTEQQVGSPPTQLGADSENTRSQAVVNNAVTTSRYGREPDGSASMPWSWDDLF